MRAGFDADHGAALLKRRGRRRPHWPSFDLLEVRSLLSLTWSPYGEASVTPGDSSTAIQVGVAGRPEDGQQPNAFHGASAQLIAAKQYQVTFNYDVSTWDSYNASYGYWDSFSASVTSVPYPQVSFLTDPLNLPFVTGGAEWGGHVLQHYTGTQTITVSFNVSSVHYLNFVLDTQTQPQGDTNYPSWGTFTVTAVRAISGVEQVSYSGDHEYDVSPDNGDPTYTAPQYLDNNANGNTTDPGDHNNPVVYVAGSTPTIAAQFTVGDMANPTGGVMVKGTGPDGISIPATTATLSGNTVSLPATAASTAFGNAVNYYPKFVISWQISFDGGSTWLNAGKSNTEIDVSLKDPKNAGSIFETLSWLSSKAAKGDTTEAQVIADIWNQFPGLNIQRKDGTPLAYYATFSGASCTTTAGLLQGGQGQCSAFAHLFLDLMKTQGIAGSTDGMAIKYSLVQYSVDTTNGGFLVKNWKFSDAGGVSGVADYPYLNLPPLDGSSLIGDHSYNWGYADVTDQPGIPGQNSTNPASFFNNHQIVKIGSSYYDPSYGVTYTSLADMESKSIAGYYLIRTIPVDESKVNLDLNGNGNKTDIVNIPAIIIQQNPGKNQLTETLYDY
jgi:hypothetical protein